MEYCIVCSNCGKGTPIITPMEIIDTICFRCGEWNTLVLKELNSENKPIAK